MDNKGFLRTLEAIIAIIMVLGFILFITPSKPLSTGEVPGTVEASQNLILEEFANNKTYRDCILQSKADSCRSSGISPCNLYFEEFIQKSIPAGYEFNCEVCPSAVSCVSSLSPDDKTVYARDTFVSGKPPKVFRVYMWER